MRRTTDEATVAPGAVTSRPTPLNAARKRKLVHLTLSPEAIVALGELAAAEGSTKSGVVEVLVRRASRRAMTAR